MNNSLASTHDKKYLASVEEFILFESDLLDDWRLTEWFELFLEDAHYTLSPRVRQSNTSNPELPLINDNHERLRERVNHLVTGDAWAERPRSHTRRILSNIRLIESDVGLQVRTNFIVYQFRHTESWNFVGTTLYNLLPHQGGYLIKNRSVQLDHETISSQRRISIIV